jgi:chemotaxis protein methyltransferase CheR
MNNFRHEHFIKFKKLIYERFGIDYRQEKRELLRVKVTKLMDRSGFTSYDDYFKIIEASSNKELTHLFIDEITIHKTDFFREKAHFDFISENIEYIMTINKKIKLNEEIRVWSSACSTGEEAYSLAITLNECLPNNIIPKLLASDISRESVIKAKIGIYGNMIKNDVGYMHLLNYFDKNGAVYNVKQEIKELITFRTFNLMNRFPFKNGFDIILCRNVMIYFSHQVQEELVDKFYDLLNPGGLLFIGHSETLNGKNSRFKYIKPTIYLKA